jgi:hypothetical protein
MSLWKRGRQYWTDFTVHGKRYRKRLGTGNLQVAKRRERELLEAAGHGALADNEQGPKRLSEAIDASLAAKRMRCSPRTLEFERERLVFIRRHFGDLPRRSRPRRSPSTSAHATRPDAPTGPSTWTWVCYRVC